MSRRLTLSNDYNYRDGLFDLDSLFTYAVNAPFDLPAEITLHACVMGENDEANWHWIFEHNEQFYYARGGCDYTGWDCQSGGEVEEARSLEDALNKAPEIESEWGGGRPIRSHLEKQINGDWQIGVIEG